MRTVTWDYTERAATYDKRPDYSKKVIKQTMDHIQAKPAMLVADIGAGTGKLSKELLSYGLSIHAIEPNDAMRAFGIENTQGWSVEWNGGTGETTGLLDATYAAVFFGSSFNVVDQPLALKEVARILKPDGFFCCMWNYRDLNDPLQNEIETFIKSQIPSYSYGERRVDPSEYIKKINLFSNPVKHEDSFVTVMAKSDIVEAWMSHATLSRQAAEKFPDVITGIKKILPEGELSVPYTTRAWVAQIK